MTAMTAMSSTTDQQSLSAFVGSQSGEAFADLVRRHVDLVYATARRMVGDAHVAEDVTQATFIVLARKAGRVDPLTLPGWLVNTTRLAAKEALRSQRTRTKHETQAAQMRIQIRTTSDEPDDLTAAELLPLLDDALAQLKEADRAAVVMRFLQGRSFAEVGAVMGSTEEAARKRVERAVKKLRSIFMMQGLVPSVGALMLVLAAQQATAAPAAVIASATAAVTTAGTDAGAALAEGVIKMMMWTKIKVVAGVVVLLTLGSAIGMMSLSPSAATDQPASSGPSNAASSTTRSAAMGQPIDAIDFQVMSAELLVKDVEANLEFFEKLGFRRNWTETPDATGHVPRGSLRGGVARIWLRRASESAATRPTPGVGLFFYKRRSGGIGHPSGRDCRPRIAGGPIV